VPRYLSFSGFETATTCLWRYYLKYILKLVVPENALTSFYGSIVGGVFEAFYKEQLWRSPDILQALRSKVPAALAAAYAGAAKQGRTVLWRGDVPGKRGSKLYLNEAELLADVDAGLVNGLQIIRDFQLIGIKMGAEVPLRCKVQGHTLDGRSDFVLSRLRPVTETVILDGKGSQYHDRYVHEDQLKWYAMLYDLLYGVPPDRVGFVFWRYRGMDAIKWVPFTEASLQELLGRALRMLNSIESRDRARQEGKNPVDAFPPAPCKDNCALCAYNTPDVCPAGAVFHKE
jgi:hypothetical protein